MNLRMSLQSLTLVVALTVLMGAISFADERENFTGLWWVSHGDGAPLQLRLYPDGTAWSDYPSNNPGRWTVRNGRAECVWADDWKEALLPVKGGWLKYGFRPGQGLDSKPSNVSHAIRATTRGDGWFGDSPE